MSIGLYVFDCLKKKNTTIKWKPEQYAVVHAMNGLFNNATVKIIKSFLSFFRSVGFRRTFTVYNSIHRTVRYVSSLACSFNQNRKKERKLLMILTVALLNRPFIACTTGKLPQQSQKLRKTLKIQLKSRNQR
jgi:hypothetical protein